MPPQPNAIDLLARSTPGGYAVGGPTASEPTAWAAVALADAGRADDARRACQWLASIQQRGGSVGVSKDQNEPAWPTALAILAWSAYGAASGSDQFTRSIKKAVDWALDARGRTMPRKPEIGHDTTLTGWSWAADTHSWLEPTAMFVRALQAAGHTSHPRTREAVKLITNRLLPTGGANYGNTRVLDQFLMPHVQPTGIAMWALAEESISDPRIDLSLDYLEEAINQPLGAASLAYAVMGLRAHGRPAPHADGPLAEATRKAVEERNQYKLALLTLASQEAGTLITANQR